MQQASKGRSHLFNGYFSNGYKTVDRFNRSSKVDFTNNDQATTDAFFQDRGLP